MATMRRFIATMRRFIAWRNSLEPKTYWLVAEFFIRRGTPREVFKSYPPRKEI